MRYTVVACFLGRLLMGFSLSMLLPFLTALIYMESDCWAFLKTFLLTVGVGALLDRMFRHEHPQVGIREGLAIVSLTWIFFSAFGALPFTLSSSSLSYTDAYFEAMSGLTTTGASILTDIEAHSHGILMWRATIHLMGGMGIIVLGLAVLPFLGIGGMEMFKAEVSGPSDDDKLTPRVRDTAQILWRLYAGMTGALILLLLMGGMGLFDAICHAFATVSSGGFSTKNASLAYFESPFIRWVITIFMTLAGMNYYMHYHIIHGKFHKVLSDAETRTFLYLLLITTGILCAMLMFTGCYDSLSDCITDVAFTVSATYTSTGFGLSDYETWPMAGQAIIFCILFIGACAGSTAGGVKIIRHIILAKFTYQQLNLLIHPQAVSHVRINGQIVQNQVIFGVLGFVVLYVGCFALGTIAICATGADLITASSASATCLANIGPGLGLVGPTDNFAHLTTFAKWILSFLMLLGRLEILTLAVLFTPVFWKD